MPVSEKEQQPFDAGKFLSTLTTKPGVYRMIDKSSTVIYVGKAKNLKKRVSSYFRDNQSSSKTVVMVKQIVKIDITVTHTEGEALLLENNLIKSLKPRYNILLRDDKSYPYIYLSDKDKYPRLSVHRGAKKLPGRYFGPYPSASSVRESLAFLQKVFPVRQCEDSFFRNRSRACLQYQIHRCSGPCVGLVNDEAYQQDVKHVKLFLEGKSGVVIDELVKRMDIAAKELEYEKAAVFRDQIVHLRRVQERQYVSNEKGNLDVIAIASQAGIACIQVFFIRDGLNLGNKSFFPKNTKESNHSEILGAFLTQFYLNSIKTDQTIPPTILINQEIEDSQILEEVFQQQNKSKVTISTKVRGDRARWLELAQSNADISLQSRLSHKAKMIDRYEQLQDALKLDFFPKRLECFDISHSSGEATVASCVVFGHDGPIKSDYRRFNIDGVTAGDDYGAMHQALTRRYTGLKLKEAQLPDILLIDGGKGQVSQAIKVLNELQIDDVKIIGITKGEGRRPDLDTLTLPESNEKVILPANSPALHLVQQIRDEAHRFAITAHRQKRAKTRKKSELEEISGLGTKRRQLLLKQFGGIQEIKRAGVEDLCSVKGISKPLAQKVYDYFHV